jgi:hypothetical protein
MARSQELRRGDRRNLEPSHWGQTSRKRRCTFNSEVSAGFEVIIFLKAPYL